MKVFLLAPRENWIVDRFCEEWTTGNPDVTTSNPAEADIVWLIADWAYNQISYDFLKTKKVLTSVHHIVPEKFGEREFAEFAQRDAITTAYHVPCEATELQVKSILARLGVSKPIYVRPFWVNEKLWDWKQMFPARKLLGLSEDTFYVGSFQRDTEGKDLISPKLEKGPDRFCDGIETLQRNGRNPVPLLGGWRRQYVINRLNAANIPFVYHELPSAETVSWMYAACSLYIVGSRYEGGPQAIFECASMKTPIVSTDVGAAREILHPKCIFDPSSEKSFLDAVEFASSVEAVFHAAQTVKRHYFDRSFPWFKDLLSEISESK